MRSRGARRCQKRLMAAVHTVEIADGDHAAAQRLGDFSFTGKNLHQPKPPAVYARAGPWPAPALRDARVMPLIALSGKQEAVSQSRRLGGRSSRRVRADLVANEPRRRE